MESASEDVTEVSLGFDELLAGTAAVCLRVRMVEDAAAILGAAAAVRAAGAGAAEVGSLTSTGRWAARAKGRLILLGLFCFSQDNRPLGSSGSGQWSGVLAVATWLEDCHTFLK